jgi:hypothetical protein
MATAEAGMPRGHLTLDEAAAIREVRACGEFQALDSPAVEVHASEGGTAWTVLYDEDPAFVASCLNRTVRVKPVDDVAQVPGLLGPVRRYLQTAGVALPEPRLTELGDALGRLGLDRICPLGQMPDPSPGWHHDGRYNVLDLLRWTDIEAPTSAGRWEFEHPDAGIYGATPPLAPPPPGEGRTGCPVSSHDR